MGKWYQNVLQRKRMEGYELILMAQDWDLWQVVVKPDAGFRSSK